MNIEEIKIAIEDAVQKFFGDGKNIADTDDVLEFYDWVSSETDTHVSFDWSGNLAEPTNGESVVSYFSDKLGMRIIIENQITCDFKTQKELTKYLWDLVDLSIKIETWHILGGVKPKSY